MIDISSNPESHFDDRNPVPTPQELADLVSWCIRNPTPSLHEIEHLYDRMRYLGSTGGPGSALTALAEHTSSAARFLAAAYLEASGDYERACSILTGFSCSWSRPLECYRLLLEARLRVRSNHLEEAVAPLRRSIRLSHSYRSLANAGKVLRALQKTGVVKWRRECRLAMLGNATFAFVLPALKTVAFASGINLITYSGEYNQHVQEILDPSSRLHAFRPEFAFLATDWRTLGIHETEEHPDRALVRALDEIERNWNALSSNSSCHAIQHNVAVPEISSYGLLSGQLNNGRANLIRRLNLALLERASKRTDVTILDVDEIAALFGKSAWHDERMWVVAKQYPATQAIGLLASHQVAHLRALLGLTSKCLVLDLDNTLWGGIIGEDGLEGIRLGGDAEGQAYVEFQRYIKALGQRGVALAICSKNNEPDARLPFDKHPESVLRFEDFSIFVANWQPKPENLRQIAESLNIGMESLVFLDDNPAERELVRHSLPEIEVPELPADPALFAETLHRELLFETLSVTPDDLLRTESYRTNSQREVLRTSGMQLDEFLLDLRMHLELRPFDEANLPRITQLVNKTNQFNLTTQRMTAEQLRAYAATSANYTQFVRLTDRFGESGITGVLMASPQRTDLQIDLWLMSCRVLGRRVEEAMLAAVWNFARAFGYKALLGSYVPTAKNSQVTDLYQRMGFHLLRQTESGSRIYRAHIDAARPAPPMFQISDLTRAMCLTNADGVTHG